MNSRGLIVATALLVALGGVVWWAQKHPNTPDTASNSPKIVELQPDQAQQISIAKKDQPAVVLKKQNGKWQIVEPGSYSADQDAVSSLLTTLNPLTADSVVEEKASDKAKFGLSVPALTVTVAGAKGHQDVLEFGDDAPAGAVAYLERAGDPKVYAVSNSSKSGLDKSLNDLRDKRLVSFDSTKLTGIDLTAQKQNFSFGKNASGDWQIVKPTVYRADSFQVEELIRKLQDAKADLSVAADEQKKQAALFATGSPVASVKVTDAAGAQTLEVRKNKTDFYARGSSIQGIYKITEDAGSALDKGIADFRTKKLFDFGFNDPAKLSFRDGSSESTYQKSGSEWVLSGKNMDSASVQATIDQLRDLSASGFPQTGFANPTLNFAVVSKDGKLTEKVALAKVGDHYVAKRDGEAALYDVPAKNVEDLVKAFNQIKPAAPKKK